MALLALLDSSGLSFINRGLTGDVTTMLLYSAAHHRTCSQPCDRIYGIMQVYGFQLGASKRPGRSFTLAELEDQFGAALNIMSPIVAQTHIPTKPPPFGSAWRPTRSSVTPEMYYLVRYYDIACSITYQEKAGPLYRGKACALPALREFWRQGNALNESLYTIVRKEWQHYLVNIHLDASDDSTYGSQTALPHVHSAQEPELSCPCSTCSVRRQDEKDGLDRFIKALPQPHGCYSILLLGSGAVMRFVRSEREDGSHSGTKTYTIKQSFGVLVVRPSEETGAWRRIGIVSWEPGRGHLDPVHEALWKDIQCRFC